MMNANLFVSSYFFLISTLYWYLHKFYYHLNLKESHFLIQYKMCTKIKLSLKAPIATAADDIFLSDLIFHVNRLPIHINCQDFIS